MSGLDAHATTETPLQYAVKMVAGLIAPPYLAIDGGRPINEHSLGDYVRASLGMEHDAARIDPDLAPYLDELSKVQSTEAEPVTESSFRLLCILYMHITGRVPDSSEYA